MHWSVSNILHFGDLLTSVVRDSASAEQIATLKVRRFLL